MAPIRIDESLLQAAAQRLVSQSGPDVVHAARRLISAAPTHGIDLSLIFATVDPGPRSRATRVRQACLAVPGAGRTVMLFLSEPPVLGDPGGRETGVLERTQCLLAAIDHLKRERGAALQIAQGLPEPREKWSIDAFRGAGFVSVGELVYMRRSLSDRAGTLTNGPVWPPRLNSPLEFSTLDTIPAPQRTALLVEALDRSYENTLDCPELCGLRDTPDILASHQSTGIFDPSLWGVIRVDGRPEGCVLLNRCPDQRVVELVYLGISEKLRGRGVARTILGSAVGFLRTLHPAWSLNCAVDRRNGPAIRLYDTMGMRAFSERVAFVLPTREQPTDKPSS